jgi:hypothetical protein
VIVTSPSNATYYGNNVKGDELNNNERVVVDTPEVGVYTVRVQAKVFGAGTCAEFPHSLCQAISTVAVSSGEVVLVSEGPIDPSSFVESDERKECTDLDSALFYVGLLGSKTTWGKSTVSINSSTYMKTMSPEDISSGYVNPWYPAVDTACLKDDLYTLSYYNNGTSLSGSIDACGAYVTFIQPSFDFTVKNGKCDCEGTWTTVEMTALNSETWYDYYYYEIAYKGESRSGQNRTVWRGSLAIANTQNIRLCLPYGTYSVSLKTIDDVPIDDDGIGLKISSCGVSLSMAQTKSECVLSETDDSGKSDNNQWVLDGSWNFGMITLIVVVVVAVLVIAAVGVGRKIRLNRRDDQMNSKLLK